MTQAAVSHQRRPVQKPRLRDRVHSFVDGAAGFHEYLRSRQAQRVSQIGAAGENVHRLLHPGQAASETCCDSADARNAGQHDSDVAVGPDQVQNIIRRCVERNVAEVYERNVVPRVERCFHGIRGRTPASFARPGVRRHGKGQRQDLFSAKIYCRAGNIQRKHMAGGCLRRGNDSAALQRPDRLHRQQLRVAGTDADSIKSPCFLSHSPPYGTKSSVEKQGTYRPGSMR